MAFLRLPVAFLVLVFRVACAVSLSTTLVRQSWHEFPGPFSSVYILSAAMGNGDAEIVYRIQGSPLIKSSGIHNNQNAKKPHTNSGPWTYDPICTDILEGVGDKLCVYTSTSFSSGRGISLFTTPKIASEVQRLRPFTDPSVFTEHSINTFSGTWTTTSLPNRGIGLLATNSLSHKTRITAYTPALLAVLEQDLSTMDREKYYRIAINQLPQKTRDLYMNLSFVYGDERVRVQDIVQGNTFQMELAGRNHLAVFPETSRVNHDCAANAQYYLDPELLTHFIHAIRPIAPGEEITISYTSPLEPTATRQQHLQQGFHFTCTCARCTSPDSDTFLATIHSLQASLNDWSANSLGSPHIAERLLNMYRKEGLEGFLDVPYGFAALAYNAVGDTEKATMYAEKAKEAILLKDGKWSPNLGLWEEVLAAPERHWSFERRIGR